MPKAATASRTKPTRADVIDALLKSEEPSIRWKALVRVLGEDPDSSKTRALREEIRNSPRARGLIASRDRNFAREEHPYGKWRGSHWTLAMLAEIGYPTGDESLVPMRDRVLHNWLAPHFYVDFETKAAIPKSRSSEGVPLVQGRYRRCASQQGYALYSIVKLGLAGPETARLAERLLHWQWPDGGWNCDRKPSAHVSSFNESILPMLGLWVHAELRGDRAARDAALRASELFLSRRLYKSRTSGKVVTIHWTHAKYPRYWHYDYLGGLVAMAEMGLVNDPRCADALDLLERKEIAHGGWAAEGRYYKVSPVLDTDEKYGSVSLVDWGGAGKDRRNEWVTADALYVLRAAGRL